MFEATLKRVRTGKPDLISFHVPKAVHDSLAAELEKSPDFSFVRIGKPRKPRTTGALSQNHKIAALINLITDLSGHTYNEVKTWAKFNGIGRGYPYRFIKVFHPVQRQLIEQVEPYHEDEIDTVQAGVLIQELQFICDEMGIDHRVL
jgi:hypothetical protein